MLLLNENLPENAPTKPKTTYTYINHCYQKNAIRQLNLHTITTCSLSLATTCLPAHCTLLCPTTGVTSITSIAIIYGLAGIQCSYYTDKLRWADDISDPNLRDALRVLFEKLVLNDEPANLYF